MRKEISTTVLFFSIALLQSCAPKQEGAERASGTTSATSTTQEEQAPTVGSVVNNANTAANTNVIVTAKATPWPALDFVNNPAGTDAKAVALSFDDGPDGRGSPEGKAGRTNTSYMLDQLKLLDLKATFFVCGNKWTNVRTDPSAQADIKRIVAEGHHIASHTFTHDTWDAKTMTTAQAQKELVDNQALISEVLGSAAPKLSMYRVPYGTPFQDMIADVNHFSPATRDFGVHIGWGIDPQDWLCAQNKQDSNCIMTTLNRYLDRGASGVILMHSVYKLSADTLPQVVAAVRAKGYHFVMVEDFVKAKYGVNSNALLEANLAAKFDDQTIMNAANESIKRSKWYLGVNE